MTDPRRESWSSERVEVIHAMRHERLRVVLAAVNALPGPTVSMSAFTGKRDRLFGFRSGSKATGKKTTAINVKQITKARDRAASGSDQEPYKIRCIEVESRNVRLSELEDGECRWPVDDVSPFLFCGLQQLDGSSYCAAHFRLSVGPGTTAERRAA